LNLKSRAISKDSENVDPRAYDGLGCCYTELGQFTESKSNFDKAIALNDINPEFWSNRAQAYYKFERYELAYEDFLRALKLSPEDSILYYSVGMCLFATKKYKKAIDMLKLSLEKEKECFSEMKANAYYHIGIAYCRRGKFAKAIFPLTQVLVITTFSA
jgi:tetratricopeptide (TPR) repeat protein